MGIGFYKQTEITTYSLWGDPQVGLKMSPQPTLYEAANVQSPDLFIVMA